MRSFKQVLHLSLLAILVLLPLQARANETLLDRVVAIVNDDVVLQSELDERTTLVKQQMQARSNTLPSEKVLRSQVLKRLILEHIELQIAKKQGIHVSDQELNAALQKIADKNQMTLAQFREALIAEGRDYAQAREQIRREMLIARVQQSNVNRRINVSEQEIRNYLDSKQKGDNTQYLLSNILISLPENASPETIKRKQQEADALYEKLKSGSNFSDLAIANSNAPNALNGGELGWRAANALPQSIAQALAPLKVGGFTHPIRTPAGFHLLLLRDKKGSKKALVQQTLVSHILISPSEIRSSDQAHQLAEDLYKRLQQGQPFAELAKQYSDDPASGSQGGDLGWVQSGQMVPEFEQVMNDTKVGQISEPFQSRFGWHILKVRDRRTQDMGKQMRENEARSAIRKRKYSEEFDNWIRQIRSQAYVELKDVTTQ